MAGQAVTALFCGGRKGYTILHAANVSPAAEQFSPFSFSAVDNPPVSVYTRHRYVTSA
ncbi:MAG: hypothetical protein LBH00_04630 [Planctomycetaceae bacterium]|nr:hypothetical protein [Planctomycetaceae bacterium]